MLIRLIDEYNEHGHLMYAENLTGAYIRGKTVSEALDKLSAEVFQYMNWIGKPIEDSKIKGEIIQEKYSTLSINDADSDIIFESEKAPLTAEEYEHLKALALKSAKDFKSLYDSIPNKTDTVLSPRRTFYGNVPVNAEEMYQHTKSVNSYYFGEINIDADNEPDILTCRESALKRLEETSNFLSSTVCEGSYGELWSLRKVMRRFIWHDRIHAKAMYRMAVKLCGFDKVLNPFCFNV